MAEIRVEDPELMETKRVNKDGRVYLGNDYSGKKVKLIIDEVEEVE